MKTIYHILSIVLAICSLALATPSDLWLDYTVYSYDLMENDSKSESEKTEIDDDISKDSYVDNASNKVNIKGVSGIPYFNWNNQHYEEHVSRVVSPPPEVA